MFMYYEKYYAGADMSFSALIICQSSNGNEVLYYENVNYIIKEQALYTQSLTEFENEEIEQLKAANDWNKEINLDKCIRKEIITKKPTIPYEQEIKDKIIEEFHLISGEYALFVNFLTSDSDNSNFMIYGSIYHNENNGIYFIGFVESDGASFKELNILVPSNPYDYKTELIEFKKANGWG